MKLADDKNIAQLTADNKRTLDEGGIEDLRETGQTLIDTSQDHANKLGLLAEIYRGMQTTDENEL